ncbi:hypothetical protein GGR58DRAFT_148840 [Xylaria digitata]|nr:hypothetical protein GGR58DRAFT_148840 [Xylaria digitata]
MSTPQKQREIVRKKQAKMHKAQRKYDTQSNVVNARVTEIRALCLQKEELMREAATINHPYEVSLATIERHEQRLAESGRPGGNGEFEKNARKGLEMEKKKCEEAEDRIKARIKAVAKNIEKAQRSEQKAREKLDELHDKLVEAKTQVRAEQGRWLRSVERHQRLG